MMRPRDRCCDRWAIAPFMEVIYWNHKADFELITSPDWLAVKPVSFWQGFKICFESRCDTLEVPEPLWTIYWPRAVMYILAAKVGALRQHRPLRVVSYALENLEPLDRLSIPNLDGLPRLSRALSRALLYCWGWTLHLLDGIQFSTHSSYLAYRGAWPALDDYVDVRIVTALLEPCAECTPEPIGHRPKEVLFLGELTERKGIPHLLHAWTILSQQAPDWTLRLIGSGPLFDKAQEAAEQMDGLIVEGLVTERRSIHLALSRARVVVLPSVRVKRWREQVGLSLLEGEAHGCRLVTTTESGLASELPEGAGFICAPADPLDLVRALRAAMRFEVEPPPRVDRHNDRQDFMCWATHET